MDMKHVLSANPPSRSHIAEVLKGPLTLVTTWNHPTLVTAGGRRAETRIDTIHLFGSNRAECDDFGIFTYKNITSFFLKIKRYIFQMVLFCFFPVLECQFWEMYIYTYMNELMAENRFEHFSGVWFSCAQNVL